MNNKPTQVFTRTNLAVLALAYAITLPWLIWGEVVSLVPLLCALVFGYCLIKPSVIIFQQASKIAKIVVLGLIVVVSAGIVFTLNGGHEQTFLRHVFAGPTWLINHLFFAFFGFLPLTKGIAVCCIQVISDVVSTGPKKS